MATIEELLIDKSVKAKEKTAMISNWILNLSLPVDKLIAFSKTQKDAAKATCIEAMEYATKQKPEIGNELMLDYITGTLSAKAPRIKWESAKVIANVAHLYPGKLREAAACLLINTKHEGTVVRWSPALALGEILKTTTDNSELRFAIEEILVKEEKNSIKKIYQAALNKTA